MSVTLLPLSAGWNVTVPALFAPLVLRQAMISSSRCSTISASHSFSRPPTVAFQCSRLSSSCFTVSTPSMKRGNSSNWVHWSYAVRTGTSTSMVFFVVAMSCPPDVVGRDRRSSGDATLAPADRAQHVRRRDHVTFRDREQAGRSLGERLREARLDDPVVLGLPRGGVVVAAGVADALGA